MAQLKTIGHKEFPDTEFPIYEGTQSGNFCALITLNKKLTILFFSRLESTSMDVDVFYLVNDLLLVTGNNVIGRQEGCAIRIPLKVRH